LIGIDEAEAAERQIRSGWIDAVDVDLFELIVVDASGRRQVGADLPRKLMPESDHVLIGPGLMQIRVEQQRRTHAPRRRRRDRRLDAVPVEVHVARGHAAGVAEGHDVVAAIHLLVQARVAGAQHIAGVLRHQIGDARSGVNRRALLPINIQQLVMPPNPVHAQAEVRRHAGMRPPGVLKIQRGVLVVFGDRRQPATRTRGIESSLSEERSAP